MDMIHNLLSLLPDIRHAVQTRDGWDSLVINRRKPHTFRVSRKMGDFRVCLHRFEPCGPEDAFPHPHPWPGAILIMHGSYIQRIGHSPSLQEAPTFYYTELLRPYSLYEIVDPLVWHSVQPVTQVFTIMVNGAPWESQHTETRTTKGKDLESMSPEAVVSHLSMFDTLLHNYLREFSAGP
jgi:hypothetical protein